MKKRIALLLLALLLPVFAAMVVARFALPGMVAPPVQKTMPIAPTSKIQKIPETLEDAKKLTRERLEHLKKLSQSEWDVERKAIPHKFPPEKIKDAVARAQLRLNDLNNMQDIDWQKERTRLRNREHTRQAAEND